MERYLFDTNLFITSENFIPRDIFGGFWKALGSLLTSGTVILHETVLDELKGHKDPLLSWAEDHAAGKVMSTTEAALDRYLEICSWANAQGYDGHALREFERESNADAWLCAEALASDLTIVTYEKASNGTKSVKIPNVCDAFGIRYMHGFDFMRLQGFHF